MTCEYVFRDITDIYVRLFNHRAALQGLTNNFVKEFEEKRGDRETTALTKSFEMMMDTRDRVVPSVSETLENQVETFKSSVDKTIALCQRIQQDSTEKKTDFLESQRTRRENEWKDFMNAQVARSSRVDQEFESKVQSLRKHYDELEEKLRGATNKVL